MLINSCKLWLNAASGKKKRDVWENSVPMVFLGHQGLVWDRGVSPLLGWGRANMAGVFFGPQLSGVEGPQSQEGSCFKLCTAASAL